MGVSRDCQIFLSTPIISGTGKATNFKLGGCIHRVHANKSPLKFGRIGSVGESRDSQLFEVPPIISVMGKATNVEFGRCIQMVRANKSPLKFWEKMERGHIQGLSKFFEYPLLSPERVKLRTSTFVRTFLASIGTKVRYKFLQK